MRWVPAAAVRPNRCVALPQLGSHDPKGYFDLGGGRRISPHADYPYVSVVAVELMAARSGWVPPGDALALKRKVGELEAALAQVQAERDELRARFDAIDVLASEGFTARKKTGRPATTQKAVA